MMIDVRNGRELDGDAIVKRNGARIIVEYMAETEEEAKIAYATFKLGHKQGDSFALIIPADKVVFMDEISSPPPSTR